MGSFRLANDYWQEYTKNVKQCYLSSTNGHAGVQDISESFEAISIAFRGAKDLQNFCKEHGIEQDIAIRTAWVLVLGRYTDLEEVCFCVHDRRRGDTLSGICRMNINPGDTLTAMLARVQEDAVKSSYFHIDLLQETLSTVGGFRLPEVCNSAVVQIRGQSHDTALEPTGVRTLELLAFSTNSKAHAP